MERNDRASCTGNYCHIHTRHLFIKDRQDKGESSIYLSNMEKFGQLFYKATTGKTFQCVQGNYHGMETFQ